MCLLQADAAWAGLTTLLSDRPSFLCVTCVHKLSFCSLSEGVQLLCLIDKAADACRYLQTYGEWNRAAWLAKVTWHDPRPLTGNIHTVQLWRGFECVEAAYVFVCEFLYFGSNSNRFTSWWCRWFFFPCSYAFRIVLSHLKWYNCTMFSHFLYKLPPIMQLCNKWHFSDWHVVFVFPGSSEPIRELRRAEALGGAPVLPTGQPQIQSHPGAAVPGLLLQSGRDAPQVRPVRWRAVVLWAAHAHT